LAKKPVTIPLRKRTMSPEERDRMQVLCERIAKEQDRDAFTALVQELDELLDTKRKGLDQKTG
jgi:hypothetical protein